MAWVEESVTANHPSFKDNWPISLGSSFHQSLQSLLLKHIAQFIRLLPSYGIDLNDAFVRVSIPRPTNQDVMSAVLVLKGEDWGEFGISWCLSPLGTGSIMLIPYATIPANLESLAQTVASAEGRDLIKSTVEN
jgi:hypothetical protein